MEALKVDKDDLQSVFRTSGINLELGSIQGQWIGLAVQTAPQAEASFHPSQEERSIGRISEV
jgi:hypothetical protein